MFVGGYGTRTWYEGRADEVATQRNGMVPVNSDIKRMSMRMEGVWGGKVKGRGD